VDAYFVTQYRNFDHRGKFKHNSDHQCYIFKIKKEMTKECRFNIMVPQEMDKIQKFMDSFYYFKHIFSDKILDKTSLL